MATQLWRPPDEASAAGNLAVFVEWLRATGRLADAQPLGIRRWASADQPAFAAAITAFAGLDPVAGFRCNLLRRTGPREALVDWTTGTRLAWSWDALRAGAGLPEPIGLMFAAGRFADVVALAADHLLAAETRPDDRLLWASDPADPWPAGAWTVGATLILAAGQAATRIAARENARVLAARPAPWAS